MRELIYILLLMPSFLFAQRDIDGRRIYGNVNVKKITSNDIVNAEGLHYDIRAYGAIANDSIDDYTAISEAIDSCNASGGGTILICAGTYETSATLTFPDNINLHILQGSKIDAVATNENLIINGTFDAGIYQCFGDSVTVFFDTAAVAIAYPEWWGLSIDSTDQNALNAMWQAFPAGRKPEMKLTGSYYTNDTWLIRESFRDSTGYSADEKGISRDHVHIVGYGSAIYSTADTILKVQLGWLTQSEPNHNIEGLRIFGDGYVTEPDDRDVGTNIGIAVEDVGNFKIYNCSVRNCSDAIQIIHVGPGTIFTPYCDGIHIMENTLTCNDRGIVFVDADVSSDWTANFDHTIITGNEIGIQEGNDDSDTLDACIVIGQNTWLSRSNISNNMMLSTGDSLNGIYINGGIGGSYVSLWYEGNGYAFRIGDNYQEAYGIHEVQHHSYSIYFPYVFNASGKRFNMVQWDDGQAESTAHQAVNGITFTDFTGNIRQEHLDIISATSGNFFNAEVLYLFKDEAYDTVVTDYSLHYQRNGTLLGDSKLDEIEKTGWTVRSFENDRDYLAIPNTSLNGDAMIVAAIIPDSAYDAIVHKYVFKWLISQTTYCNLMYATGSNSSIFEVQTPAGGTVANASIPFSAGDVLIYGCILDSSNNKMELWLNGHSIGSTTYTNTLPDSQGTTGINAQWGNASLWNRMDMGFFAIYPYVNREMIRELSKNLMTLMGNDNYKEVREQYKGNDIVSASTITLNGGTFFDITGTTQIDSISVNSPQESGTIIYLQFDANVTVADGKNLLLKGNYSAIANDILTLIRDSDYFKEISRNGASGGSGDFYAADFGDSLVNYDGFGITITNNDAIDIDSSDVVTKYSYDHVTDFLNFGQDYPKGAEADTSWFWKNKTGATVTIDSIEAISDFNTFRMIWVESDENGGNVSRVDSMACTVAGTNRYYKTEATISAATIESNHWIGLVRSVDEADYFSAAINYHYVRP